MSNTDQDPAGDRGPAVDRESVVREYYDLVDAEAYDELFELFTDDVRYARPGQEAIEGKTAFESFYHDGRPLEDGTHQVDSVVVEGDTVAVRGRFTGTQDGEAVSFAFADFHEFDGDSIARRYTYTDRDEV